MTITPDDKDWTWVIEQPCSECGFDSSSTKCTEVAEILRAAVERWRVALVDGASVGTRARPGYWSTLEYGCHVRDVFRVYEGRLTRMLTEDGPHYENWDQDRTARDEDYPSQEPRKVAAELVAAGTRLADQFASVADHQWERTGYRSDGAAFTIDTFARYFIHDIVHHLYDING